MEFKFTVNYSKKKHKIILKCLTNINTNNKIFLIYLLENIFCKYIKSIKRRISMNKIKKMITKSGPTGCPGCSCSSQRCA